MRLFIRLSPIVALLALAACETVQGAGRDLQSAGEFVEQESYDTQQGM
ncbi:Predicted small secreted protein [Paracoccus halophilus]|uniref:Entericidin EcnAB n=1 Tax=Paracoccus halophilus TaxID=376733 RepID=A0A099F312_9RHOB|nr:entericidin A/B family lipoprotein [Paracoccus halophilus]KGJ04668.1 entericidin EcnAB [Paracoccus halophilus]SFA49769.1 Predicted small secreted protein [Paracoccus halophilus]